MRFCGFIVLIIDVFADQMTRANDGTPGCVANVPADQMTHSNEGTQGCICMQISVLVGDVFADHR